MTDKKIIIAAAVCGALFGREKTPYIPITPEEIAESVIDCAKAGAAIAHIHVRDENGKNVIDTERFREVLNIIKESGTDIVINLTTACDFVSDEARMVHLAELKPEMASLDIGSLNWGFDHIFENSPQFIEKISCHMRDNDIKPELEIFDYGMINQAKYYMQNGMIVGNPHFQIVLGVPGAIDATVENLLFLINKLPENSTWSACGIGKATLDLLFASIALGADAVRVGLEDNIYYSKGELAVSNTQLVKRAVRISKESGREIATPDDARRILGLINRPLL